MATPLRTLVAGKIGRLVLLLAIGIVGFTLYRNSQNSEPPEPIVIGITECLQCLSAIVADELGYFRDAGLVAQIKRYPSGKAGLADLRKKENDVAMVAETPLVLQAFESADFAMVSTVAYSFESVHAVARSDSGIRQAAQLKGRRVAVTKGTSAHYYLHMLLLDGGVALSEITEVELPPPKMAEALGNNQVDVIIAWQPWVQQAMTTLGKDAVVVESSRQLIRDTVSYVMRREFIDAHPLAVQRLLAATGRANAWIQAHPAEAAALAARQLKIEPALAQKLIADIRYELMLDQTNLVSLETQIRWARGAQLVADTKAPPRLLNYLAPQALGVISPGAVSYAH